MINTYPLAFSAYNKNLEIRLDSTSGGVFTVLALYFLKYKQAVVYGAAFDNNFEVEHIRIENDIDLEKLRGSKYPQSKIGDSFKNIRQDLENGRYVFFTGTPCQVYGLKKYLNDKYQDQLYCMDFVCHGVASRSVWKKYVEKLSQNGKIKKIIFKSKPKGWKKWYFRVEYQNRRLYQIRGKMNLFMRSYLSYCNIRPSCYECAFKGLSHVSDFTISDCWGIGEQNKEMNDNRGLSAVLIQNDRALVVFNAVKKYLQYLQYEPDTLMKGNWTAYKCVQENPVRKAFFMSVKKDGGYKALRRYFTPTKKNWIKYYIDRLKGMEN